MIKHGCVLNNKYRVERPLGRGGMGDVYLCTNLELGNQWALKHIKFAGNSDAAVCEVDILKKVNHILLPKIVDSFRDESGIYIVQSYIEGISLNKRLEYFGCIDEETAVDWILQLCDVLSYLHNMEPAPIVHRDLKPSNIILTPDKRVILIDFGIAKEYVPYQRDTIQGGTRRYSAPEQLLPCANTDQRADIYCLGILLIELLAGRLPDNGSMNSGGSDLGSYVKSIKLRNIIDKCTRLIVDERYKEIDLLRADLEIAKKCIVQEQKNGKIKIKIYILVSIILSFVIYGISLMNLFLP